MRGYLVNGEKKECFGCGACFQICPQKAISMQRDNEGFLYPNVDEKACVLCNQCHQVCPHEHLPDFHQINSALVGYNSDTEVRIKSASGGAFKSIVDVANEDTKVFGVVWSGRSEAVHTEATKKEAYDLFHKSKYIQSDTGLSFKKVKNYLVAGISVIYVGTPCQIAGLKTFLNSDDKNLLCIDIVCHGVPSGKVLEKYFQSIEKRGKVVYGIDFRHKVFKRGAYDSKCALIRYSDGINRVVDYDSSGFLRGFANGLFFRPSCSECPFAKAERVSDLTIGDAWGIEKSRSDLNPHEGVSLILVNTEKGKSIVKKICNTSCYFSEVEPDIVISGNGRLKKPDAGHSKRNVFFERYEVEDFERLVQSYIPKNSRIRKIGHRIKNHLKKG